MYEIFKQAFVTCIKQWQLLLLTIIIHTISQLDPGLGEINFGLVLILAIPLVLSLIFDFSLTHFIAENQTSPKSLKVIAKQYYLLVPKLFFPLIGLTIVIGIVMTIIAVFTYGLLSVFRIENSKSLFDAGPKDINFVLFYLLFNFTAAFFVFQAPLYFIKKEKFFDAFFHSIKIAKHHLKFTGIVGLIYLITLFTFTFIGNTYWYQNLIVGTLTGLQFFYVAAFVLHYYQNRIENLNINMQKMKKK